jgi:D-3-phosphoglycerate dehydrogenase
MVANSRSNNRWQGEVTRVPTAIITDAEFADFSWEQNFFAEHGITLVVGNCRTPQEAVALVADADAVITNRCPINREVIAHLNRCRIIVRYGVGVDNVDIAAATEKGIIVCNVPDYSVNEVATHAVALLLCCWRKVHVGDAGLKRGEWQNYRTIAPVHRTIGKTVGLFGFGRIARRVAELLYPFGFRPIAFDPYVPDEEMLLHGTEKVEFAALLERSDAISVHAPLTDETRGIFNRDAFARMKRGVVFVNTARGGLVDEEALLWALDEGIVSQRQVWMCSSTSRIPTRAWCCHPKVIATPHWAWYSEEALWELRRKVAEQVVQALKGERPTYALNFEAVTAKKSE